MSQIKHIFPKQRIGKTSLEVSTLGFGAAAIGNLYIDVNDEIARKTLRSAINSDLTLKIRNKIWSENATRYYKIGITQ